MSDDTTIAIAATEARSSCKDEPDLLLRIEKAMRACRDHWLGIDDDSQFKAAIMAAMLESEGDERDRIERSVKALARINAMLMALQNNVPVDTRAMAREAQDEDLLPLVKIWHKTKTGRAA